MATLSVTFSFFAFAVAFYCYRVIARAFLRSVREGSSTHATAWTFALSKDFVHPRRGLVLGGFFGGLLAVFLGILLFSVANACAEENERQRTDS